MRQAFEAPEPGSPRLDRATKLVKPKGWTLKLYPDAGEAGGSHQTRRGASSGAGERDPERSAREAARRARGKLRRYAAANGLTRLTTLTYGGDGCFDPREVRYEAGRFFKRLRRLRGGRRFPYAWVPEWHKTHGLHLHAALPMFVPKEVLAEIWGHGFVDPRLIRAPEGVAERTAARVAANYLSKYMQKELAQSQGGLHRYEVAQGFQPREVVIQGGTAEWVVRMAARLMQEWPKTISYSDDWEDYEGPPAVKVEWA